MWLLDHRDGRARSAEGTRARWRTSSLPTAWRYFDGSFMPESVKLEARIAEYERTAIGGRKRAETAPRRADGRLA
jgi:hypothetical protein